VIVVFLCIYIYSGGSPPQNFLREGIVASMFRATWKISRFCAHLRSVACLFDTYVGNGSSPHS
jgi:hypothetical protein